MKTIYRDYMFSKGIFVSEGRKDPKEAFETLFSLARFFAIRITDGAVLAGREMISYAEKMLGTKVPEPFYRHFPDSARQLSSEQLLFDQAVHYMITYGFGDFSESGHSIYEQSLERDAFKEDVEQKNFIIVDESTAYDKLRGYASSLMDSSRPMSTMQYELVLELIRDGLFRPERIASKNTAVMLMNDLRDLSLAKFLSLSDVMKVLLDLQFRSYGNMDPKQLNLKNKDRMYLTRLIDSLIAGDKVNTEECFEKRDLWKGLLHHIHYRPLDEKGAEFVSAMREGRNLSVYSDFEKAMAGGNIRQACDILRSRKGPAEVLRKLDYMVSRSRTTSDMDYILEQGDTSNLLVLLQLLIRYGIRTPLKQRVFAFSRFNTSMVHAETREEMDRRKSMLSVGQQEYLEDAVRSKLSSALKGRLGKVYISPEMKDTAVPLNAATQQGGYGVMNTSSRIHLSAGKKIRAFTYWEKVNDIDLSAIGLTGDGDQIEFSWRTMASNQSDAVTYSGDETSGYKGGSEFFDIDPEAVKKKYPDLRYIAFCNNVYSGTPFSACTCRAGYMLRDIDDSGEIFEPKTVKSSFTINCESTFAYLFALDLVRNDFVWLNIARGGSQQVAGESSLFYLVRYINATDIINMHSFFSLAATEITDDPEKADVIVSDTLTPVTPGKTVIHSTDSEKIMAVLSGRNI